MPPIGHVVLIWWHTREISAHWTGSEWRTRDNAVLQGPITHWREA
jgi:hypothetical protein